MDIKGIIKGHYNELMNNEEELSKARMKICKECPLFKQSEIGALCNSALYLDVETNTATSYKKEGTYKGCGCRLNAKTRATDAECPALKW